jgi:hypothetical protein
MKIFIILFSLTSASLPQQFQTNFFENKNIETADTSLLDYFPLHEGNLWQYRYRDNSGQMGYIENMISYGDTIMPDGFIYSQLFNPPYKGTGYIKYCRIDSLYNLREYVDTLCNEFYDPDNLGFWDPPVFHGCIDDTSVSVFKLNVADSTYWLTYFNIGDNLFWPSLRYMGEYETEIFGIETQAKIFTQYFRQYYPSDSTWVEYYGWSYVLLKGIGIYSTGFGESSTATLQGAIINGVKYGTVVGIDEHDEYSPSDFTLYQNYPNPFNPITTIRFEISKITNVKLKVLSILGEEIEILVNEIKYPGSYEVEFNASQLSSGVYIAVLQTEETMLTRTMLLIK